MTAKISDSVLAQLSEFVASHLGLHFPKERWLDLERGVCRAAQECGYRDDLRAYVQGLVSPGLTPRQLEVVACHLTVGETYFFREKRSLEVFERDIVPELIRERAGSGRAIRIWSAGCATGEEPYSIAVLLSKLMAESKRCNFEILATDVNVKSLQRAAEGIYREWSFRGTPPWLRSTYCDALGDDCWAITPTIKEMVRFARLNLMDDAYAPASNGPNGFDVIFCRNVLMYLTPEVMRKVVRQLHHCLAADGWLIVSPTETLQELFSDFATVSFPGVTFYRKSATPLAPSIALSLLDQEWSGVQLPEWASGAEPIPSSALQTPPENSCSEARSGNTSSRAVSYEQALLSYEQGCYEEVEYLVRALVSIDRNHSSAMLLLARAYANRGELASALEWCDQAIASDKMAARAYYLRATILEEQGSPAEALLALKQAVYAEQEFILGHFALGNLALKQGRRRESKKHFENVLLLLARYGPDEILPEFEGLSAGRLREMMALPASKETAMTQTRQPRIRVPQSVERLERSRW
jgi:chemotaxis protein methyltransferase CheR